MAVAAIMANVSRIMVWLREVDWRAFAAYAVPGAPTAALGARTMLALPPRAVDSAMAVFLIAMIPVRHWIAANLVQLRLFHLTIAGAVVGLLTGIVAATGSSDVPFVLAYGLTKRFHRNGGGCLARSLHGQGLGVRRLGRATGELDRERSRDKRSLMGGAFVAKPLLLRLAPETFRYVMDALLLVSGASLLWGAVV